eukprot:m.1016667 g.1016667  ORF g.1016667 m.1016667 type:complete len:227 (+) comp24082_c1_seq2:281-961(+)
MAAASLELAYGKISPQGPSDPASGGPVPVAFHALPGRFPSRGSRNGISAPSAISISFSTNAIALRSVPGMTEPGGTNFQGTTAPFDVNASWNGWFDVHVTASTTDSNAVTVLLPAGVTPQNITGLRYAWGDMPSKGLNGVFVYDAPGSGAFPASPFVVACNTQRARGATRSPGSTGLCVPVSFGHVPGSKPPPPPPYGCLGCAVTMVCPRAHFGLLHDNNSFLTCG